MSKALHLASALFVCATLLLAGAAVGQETAAPAHTADAAAVMDRMVEASGGMDPIAKINNRYTHSVMEIGGMGISLTIDAYSAKPNLMHAVAASEATGSIERGTDGTIFWERSVMTGPRILEGAEAAEALREARFEKYAFWRELYQKAELTGTDTVNGEVCDVVTLTAEGGLPEKLSIGRDSGMILKLVTVIEHQMGQIPVTAFVSDYRVVDGIKMPFRTSMEVMGQTRTVTVDSVAHNVELAPGFFDLPEDIKALLPKDSTEKQ